MNRSHRILDYLGSSRFTIVVLLLIAVSVSTFLFESVKGNSLLVISLLCALVNLLSAVCIRRAFSRSLPLLVFHLALAAIVVMAAASRLTYLEGRVELAEGEWFTGELIDHRSGVLHDSRLDEVRFLNDGFTVDYLPGVYRNATVNRISYRDEQDRLVNTHIGDHRPLVMDDYRFYTTFNKGFAPTFRWSPHGSDRDQVGTVNLPSFPAREFEQAQSWVLPGTDEMVWAMLVLDEKVVKPEQSFSLGVPAKHHIVVRQADSRDELRPGDSLALHEGSLTYEGLRLWMGYRVFYDWTRPWMIAACLLAVAAMAYYYLSKFVSMPITVSIHLLPTRSSTATTASNGPATASNGPATASNGPATASNGLMKAIPVKR